MKKLRPNIDNFSVQSEQKHFLFLLSNNKRLTFSKAKKVIKAINTIDELAKNYKKKPPLFHLSDVLIRLEHGEKRNGERKIGLLGIHIISMNFIPIFLGYSDKLKKMIPKISGASPKEIIFTVKLIGMKDHRSEIASFICESALDFLIKIPFLSLSKLRIISDVDEEKNLKIIFQCN